MEEAGDGFVRDGGIVAGGEQEFRSGEGAEGAGEGEVLVEEEGDGDKLGAGVFADAGFEVAVGRLKDERRNVVVLRAEMNGERGGDAGGVDDDGRCGELTCGGEVFEGGIGVGLHGGFGGMLAGTAAVAAIVEEEDVEVGVVESAGCGESVSHGAVAGVKQESRGSFGAGCA